MAKLDQYRNTVQDVLSRRGGYKPKADEFERQLVFDRERDHYLVLDVGWNDQHRIHSSLIHVDIRDEKIWIQRDFTEPGVANELLDLGVPKEDIVLAFQAPFKRPYTGFAVS